MRSLWLTSLLLVACKHDEAPPKPFTGKLTIDLVKSLKMGSVHNCEDTWDVALAKLESRLGKPTQIEGKQYRWAAVEGDRCALAMVERGECPPTWNKPGPRLEIVYEPVESRAGGAGHDACVAAAGAATK